MGKQETIPYKDPDLNIEERINDLISRMTLSQKIAQLNCVMANGTQLNEELLSNGIGEFSALFGGQTLQDNIQLVESVQKYLIENTELGIPALIHTEALSGVGYVEATNFPVAIGLGATWDPERIREMADIIRKQMKSLGVRQAFAPVMDVARDLRWGRVGETYGENPTLISAMSVAYVKGLQGDDLRDGIAATAKHFLGYAMSEGGLNMANTPIPPRELREVYAKPFEAAIRKAGLASVMNSYSSIDHEPVICSTAILRDLLRGELGFEGITVSDYMSINKIKDEYHMAEDYTTAGILAFDAGMDIEQPTPVGYGPGFREAVKQGKIDMSSIDAVVSRILRVKFELGLFENPFPDRESIKQEYHRREYDEVSYQIALESVVLLKNDDHILPLDRQCGKVAVIGPNADNIRNIFGGYTYAAFLEMMMEMVQDISRADNLEEIMGANGMTGVEFDALPEAMTAFTQIPPIDEILPMIYPMAKTMLQAIRENLPESDISYVRGCGVMDDDRSSFDEAVKAASKADIAIMVMGGKNGAGKDCTIGENMDSSSIGLPGVQEELIRAVYHTGTPIILIHMDARPLCSAWVAEHIPAVLEVWHPGQCGAQAVADILFGDHSPGGKLPFTSIRNAGQTPIYADRKRGSGYDGRGVNVFHSREGGYVNESGKPLFPFGHGLSYTQFEISDLALSEKEIAPKGFIEITCTVTNTGACTGDEVVQLYFSDRYASMVRPIKELAGFKRITLAPGEKKTVSFRLYASQTAFFDREMHCIIEAGEVDIMIGASSADIKLADTFTISDTIVLENSSREYFAEATIG